MQTAAQQQAASPAATRRRRSGSAYVFTGDRTVRLGSAHLPDIREGSVLRWLEHAGLRGRALFLVIRPGESGPGAMAGRRIYEVSPGGRIRPASRSRGLT